MNQTFLPTEIAKARLPQTYEAAKQALAKCESIDECQSWADRAEALASYAKQADDDSLRRLADRIQARAVRRAGELLKTFDGRGGDRSKTAGAHPFAQDEQSLAQRAIAARAGMSEHQQKQAVRVANVPAPAFEEAVEAERPATVTKLAEMGKQSRPVPEGFKQATHLLGTVKRFAEFCRANEPETVANGVLVSEAVELRKTVSAIDTWLDRFVINLRG